MQICRIWQLVFGQVTSRCAGFFLDKVLYSDQQYPVGLISWPRGSAHGRGPLEESMVSVVSAEEFTAAAANGAQSLDISKFSNTFQKQG